MLTPEQSSDAESSGTADGKSEGFLKSAWHKLMNHTKHSEADKNASGKSQSDDRKPTEDDKKSS